MEVTPASQSLEETALKLRMLTDFDFFIRYSRLKSVTHPVFYGDCGDCKA